MNEKNEITQAHQRTFDSIRKANQFGQDYWSACKNSKQAIADHFVHVHDMVVIGSGAQREKGYHHTPHFS